MTQKPQKPRERTRRSNEELQLASDHLFYEVVMFRSLAEVMASGRFQNDNLINSAVLESFMIHVRILLDFLYADNPKSDDVIAEDFFYTPNTWVTKRYEKSELIKTVHKRVGKEIAHLTYERLKQTLETKKWKYIDIANEVVDLINLFIEIVPDENLGSKWENFKKTKKETESN
jgi:hypothetical protein